MKNIAPTYLLGKVSYNFMYNTQDEQSGFIAAETFRKLCESEGDFKFLTGFSTETSTAIKFPQC